MPETALGFYYPDEEQIPDVPLDIKKASESANDYMDAEDKQPLSWLKKGTEKQIIVCNSSGVPQYVTLGGDATIDEEGELSLTSPNHSVYRTLLTLTNATASEQAASVYIMGTNNLQAGSFVQGFQVPFIYLDDADYAVAGKTLKLRLRAQVAVNGKAPAANFTFALYKLASEGGGGNLVLAPGAAITGSSVSINAPGVNAIAQNATADFDFPADGAYAIHVQTSAKLAAESRLMLAAQLQMRHV